MLKTFFRSAPLTQGAILAAAGFILLFLGVLPVSNIVLNTYALAANRFFAGETPYTLPAAGSPLDLFPYPLLWPMMFGGIMRVALLFPIPQWQATLQLWILINAFFFWWGMSRWVDLREPRAWGFALVLLAAFAEVDLTLWYCQTNALVVGMTLLGLADHRDGKPVSAAAWLAFAAGLKVLPAFFLGALFFRERRFRLAAIVFSLAAILLPALVVGLPKCLAFQHEWLTIFIHHARGGGRLDLGTVMGLYGLESLGMFLRNAILVVTTAVVFIEAQGEIHYPRWISLGLTALLIASPRTELPTFVYAAPAMILLFTSERGIARALVAAASVAISLHAWRLYQPTLPHSEYKTFGTLALWIIALVPTLREGWRRGVIMASLKSSLAPISRRYQ